eukprot:355442-Chlamydomonas_euryale.AAC.2
MPTAPWLSAGKALQSETIALANSPYHCHNSARSLAHDACACMSGFQHPYESADGSSRGLSSGLTRLSAA